MFMCDFNKEINRQGTNAYKLELRERYFGNNDVIPLWVADMDFAAPEQVQKDIIKRAQHEIYGYTIRTSSFNQAIVKWQKKMHQWVVKKKSIEFSPGVVHAMVFNLYFSQW